MWRWRSNNQATGTDAYNTYVKGLGTVNSVETLKIDSRKLADDDGVAKIIREAEMLFIAGDDQSDYVNYWKGTKTMAAINYLLTEKKVPMKQAWPPLWAVIKPFS